MDKPLPRPLLALPTLQLAALASAILGDYQCCEFDALPPPDECAERPIDFWLDAEQQALKLAARYKRSPCAIIDTREAGFPDFGTVLYQEQTGDKVVAWMEFRRRPLGKNSVTQTTVLQIAAGNVLADWQTLGLEQAPNGTPYPTIANACTVLEAHPELANRIWWDEFRSAVYYDHPTKGTIKWTDYLDIEITCFMQQVLKIPKMSKSAVQDAVIRTAHRQPRHPLKAWLEGLRWDATPRLDTWLSDCLGVERTPYSEAVARNWLTSMIARVYRPGCQVDHMPILEGTMGKGKSTFLRILGGEWYSALPDAFGSKDFLQAIVGQWLIEVPDLAGFNRREHQHILAIITTPTDRFRASYGRHVEDYPRTCIFTATSEDDDYLQDPRGRRRFWPLRCQSIDLDAIRAQREQLFAEALIRYQGGDNWHSIPESANAEQLERIAADPWADAVLTFAENRRIVQGAGCRLSAQEILESIGVELKDQHDGMKRRIATILMAAGWSQKYDKSTGKSVRRYRRE